MNIRRERGEDKLCHILLFPQVSLNIHRFYCFKFILFSIRICPPLQGAGPGRARRGRVRDQVLVPARVSAAAAGGRGAGGRGRAQAAPGPGGGGARRGVALDDAWH